MIICYRYDELGRVDDESCTCQDCMEDVELERQLREQLLLTYCVKKEEEE